jgi:hypothetical protein
LEFAEVRPFSVNATARTELDAPVFFTTKNCVTYPKKTSLDCPSDTFEEVTNGVADI